MSDPEQTTPATAPMRVESQQPTQQPTQQQQQPSDRPAWLPPKFSNPEQMAKAYTELEKKMAMSRPQLRVEAAQPNEPSPHAATDTPSDTPAEAPTGPQADKLAQVEQTAREAVEKVGLNFDELSADYMKAGRLSPERYAQLESHGIPRAVVDMHIQGMQAVAELTMDQMTKPIGGREVYAQVAQWATSNVPKDQIDAFNRIVTGGDRAAAAIAIRDMHAQFKASMEPSFFRSGEEPTRGGDVFRSSAEITQAINDPRYRKDPAYRQEVEQRIMRSNIL